ncbi:hypothetical protein ASF49_02420 [Methylobacterium sp. Leaf104]|uniref:hypothetical protein n=1 Tax=Methylobacterium TaxID=407 RepID=UPI0006F1C3CA|nr:MULTISPECIES: hypothetical protein [Methylobacterium]KQP42710.1 hypothetical protein ASF49_02420 [Methylobacterium sp. Leaf104]MCI9878719.1 hypothetical protein [Methylobacterium goesingense]
MITADHLRRAVAEGIITEIQAASLDRLSRADAARGAGIDEPRDDERLRFVSGFADIFVTLGLFLFLGACAHFGLSALGPAPGYALIAALAWGLAEFFTRRRRMALPSIVLLVVFALAVQSAAAFALAGPGRAGASWPTLLDLTADPRLGPLPLIGGALATLLLVTLHYRRFAVPITVAAGAAALCALVFGLLLAAAPDLTRAARDGLFIAAGLGVFALAMRFDLADPARVSRRTDIAFWLHLLAAPLIVHPILGSLTAGGGQAATLGVLAIVLGLAGIALAVDRRALLVSGLVYAGLALGALVREAGFAGSTVPLSLLTLGAFILALSAGWHPLRALLLRALPRPLAARLPHPIGA